MTLPGGPANKLGNRYEKLWTLSELVRMLRGETTGIRIEDPNAVKAEFVVTTNAGREYHQAKRSHKNGKWTFATHGPKGSKLLPDIGTLLSGNHDRFVFISGSAFPMLSDLCEAAGVAQSVEEFEFNFLRAEDRDKNFHQLCKWWVCDIPTAFERLQRIEIRTIGDHELEEKIRWAIRALFLSCTDKVIGALWQIVENSVHREFTREMLVEELAGCGFPLRRLRSPADAGTAIREVADRYLATARKMLIQDKLIPRQVSQALLARLGGTTATYSVLTGGAGSGKTACVVEIVMALQERSMPVLAFRLDRVFDTSTTIDLAKHLALEESPAHVLKVAVEAAGKPGVLIIDQLDAVSAMSGRTDDAFDLVERLLCEVRELRSQPPIHSVVVCRAFDWNNDHRLRRLVPDSRAQVDVADFTRDQVIDVLGGADYDAQSFGEHQLTLLQLPQNLSLFLEAEFRAVETSTFTSVKELFDRYWDAKRQRVAARFSQLQDPWMEVIEAVCIGMTGSQQLSVAKEKLDAIHPLYLNLLESEGVLTLDRGRYGFGHESFFDYCFARVFFSRSQSLVSYLKESDQQLFLRAQVRQVLVYLRDRDLNRYVKDLDNLLSDEGIRMHIKDLAFALLAAEPNPTDREWEIWKTRMTPALRAIEISSVHQNKLSALAWRRFFGSKPWFSFAYERGLIRGWLDSGSDGLADEIVNYVWAHHRHSPDCVATILESYADLKGKWEKRFSHFMDRAMLHTSRPLFDLFLRLIDNGTLDGPPTRNGSFWNVLYKLTENRIEWIPEVMAHRFRRRATVIHESDRAVSRSELFGRNSSAAVTFLKSAERTPEVFVKHILPVCLDISDSNLIEDTPPKKDVVWQTLIRTDSPGIADACLFGTAGALGRMAHDGIADLSNVVGDLRSRETHIANHLLLALYRGEPSRYANEAATLVCDEPWRLQCGFNDNPNWCAIELIRDIVPHCTAEEIERLENTFLGYASPIERTVFGRKERGRSQYALLGVIPTQQRSSRATTRSRELERKFGEPLGEPRKMKAGIVRSPIEDTAASKMTNGQWLRAINKYPLDTRFYCPEDLLKGGARELARVLELRVTEEPNRFARLSLKFPAKANPAYLKGTLAALESAAIPSQLKLDVCRKAFLDCRVDCGKFIADVLGSIKDRLPNDTIQMLHWLATEHPDPDREVWRATSSRNTPHYGGNIYDSGINSARGRAAMAIHKLILGDVAYIDRFRTTLDRMIRDPIASVLSCVAGTLRAVYHHKPALALSLFKCANLSEDRLLGTHHVLHFIQNSLHDYFVDMRSTLERMLRSCDPEVCESGASLAAIASLIHREAEDLTDYALGGTAQHRLGIAQIVAATVTDPHYQAWSEAKLTALFNDEDPDVRREVASCFRYLRGNSLKTYNALITAFCKCNSYPENSVWILDALENTQEKLPETTYLVCESILNRFADRDQDHHSDGFANMPTVAKLVFRMYQQHQNDAWTSRLLNLIDRLCLEAILETVREFNQFER